MDHCPPSSNPPAGLSPAQVPQFVTIGFDDNGYSGKDPAATPRPYGIAWASHAFASRTNPPGKSNRTTFDGCPCRCSYYFTSGYVDGVFTADPPDMVKRGWHEAVKISGHEGGVHTHSHPHGRELSVDAWGAEIDLCVEWLLKPVPYSETDLSKSTRTLGAGLDAAKLVGFRAPYLQYNDNTFAAIAKRGFLYDCSIEEGWQHVLTPANQLWPYTLDEGSPGNKAHQAIDQAVPLVGSHCGLWEIPVHVVFVPPDELCEHYGVPRGLRASIALRDPSFDPSTGKITGLDWNCLVDCRMTKAEFLATLKYTFDCRYQGNRAPFAFGAHSDVYSDGYTFPPCITARERQEAVEEFLAYVLTKEDVRVVALEDIVHWMRDPKPL